jgi:aconitate hydratase
MVPGTEGGFTKHIPTGETLAIYDAAMRYQEAGTPLVVVAGKEYGTGSSRDWAAKGTLLLGVKAVITESYERIHRSNLIGMGVLPLQFNDGESRESLALTGDEAISLTGLENIMPGMTVNARIKYSDGREHQTKLLCRIDTENEAEYYRNGGILQKVIRDLV